MLTIGLTGGIGCGKSAVADLFTELGAPILDADQVAREVVLPGKPALSEITQRFGSEILLPDGQLDRKRLRAIIFHDEQARHDLEAILHPRIRQQMQHWLANQKTAYAILSIPLLIETGQQNTFDRILVVDCPEALQIERICTRDQVTPDQARSILTAQTSRQERLAAADDIIDNSGPLEALRPQVLRLHRRYTSAAR